MHTLSISKLLFAQFLFSLSCCPLANAMGLKDGIEGEMKRRAVTQYHVSKIDSNLAHHVLTNNAAAAKIVQQFKQKQHAPDFETKPLLIAGPCGSGKTTLAKAIAHECNMPCLLYGSDAFNDDFFTVLDSHNQPSVVVIDNMEFLNREYVFENSALARLWNQVLKYKGKNLIVGMYTYKKHVPKQIMKHYKDCVVDVPLPSILERQKILEFNMARSKKDNVTFATEISTKELAEKTQGYDCRFLETVVTEASLNAFERTYGKALDKGIFVTKADFTGAFKAFERQNEMLRTLKREHEQRERGAFLDTVAERTVFVINACLAFDKALTAISQQIMQQRHLE